jgi:hypothetical protein
MSPLALTDSEMTIVFAAAQPLDVNARDAFLHEVAERLAGMSERGDGQVFRICRELQRKFFDAPDLTPGPRRKFASV